MEKESINLSKPKHIEVKEVDEDTS